MGFLKGPLTFECFRVREAENRGFDEEDVKKLKKYSINAVESAAIEEPDVGFLAGDHLFDQEFTLEKNVLGDALHCALRIDTNQIPAAIRRAWLQMELAVLGAENVSGKPTRTQRLEAKESVEARCQEEARTGKFRRMRQTPVLWDARQALLYFGGTSATGNDMGTELFARSFKLDLGRLTAGARAAEWAAEAKRRKALDDTGPAAFLSDDPSVQIAWWDAETGNADFLGNEFLLWLWWRWETQGDVIPLPDGSEVTGMLARTLRLECPRNESGKETISAENPTKLPEAAHAIRSGKLPRKAGMILVRHGEQYELVLQPETFAISGARITTEQKERGEGAIEDRLDSLRSMHETVDLLFRAFCQQRIGKEWDAELEHIRRWLKKDAATTARKRAV